MVERTRPAPLATFFANEAPLEPKAQVSLGESVARHLRVRRLGTGTTIGLVDGAGRRATGMLVREARDSVTVEIADVEDVPTLPEVHLMVPVADRDRMLWLAEKVTELGVTSWRPLLWRRSKSVSPRGEGSMFQGKILARMTSALIQSGGGWLPDIFPEATIERAVAAAPLGTRLLLAKDGEPIIGVPMTAPVTIALGPEGGMEPAERDAFIGAAFLPVRLGDSTLRFETAGVAAVAIAAASLTRSRQSYG